MPTLALALLAILSMPLQTDPAGTTAKDREKLVNQVAEQYAAGDYAKALPTARELANLRKQDGSLAYGLAGLLARTGKTDEALQELDRAIRLHVVIPAALEFDEDFASLRGQDAFKQRIAAATVDFESAQKKAGLSWTVVVPGAPWTAAAGQPEAPPPFKLKSLGGGKRPEPKLALGKAKKEKTAPNEPASKPAAEPAALRKPWNKWRPVPMIVALHGHGGRRDDMLRLWADMAAEVGAVLLVPEAPLEGPNGGRSWGVGGRDTPARWIMAAVNDTKRRLRIDGARIVLTGFSQGGGMTFAVGLLYPKTFHGLIPMSGPFVWGDDPAIKEQKLGGQRVLIYCGEDDPNLASNKQAAAALGHGGAAVKLVTAPGLGHALPPDPRTLLRAGLEYVWKK